MENVEILLAYMPNNPLSWIIRKKLGTDYSHVAVKFYSNEFQNYMVYESNWKGVRLSSEDNWIKTGQVVVANKVVSFSDEVFAEKMAEMGKYLGADYGFLNLFEIGLGNVDLGKNRGLICSQVGYLWVKDIIKIDKPEEYITPKDIGKAFNIPNNA